MDEFPGLFAAGNNLDELRENLQEGIALILAGPSEEPATVTLARRRFTPSRSP